MGEAVKSWSDLPRELEPLVLRLKDEVWASRHPLAWALDVQVEVIDAVVKPFAAPLAVLHGDALRRGYVMRGPNPYSFFRPEVVQAFLAERHLLGGNISDDDWAGWLLLKLRGRP